MLPPRERAGLFVTVLMASFAAHCASTQNPTPAPTPPANHTEATCPSNIPAPEGLRPIEDTALHESVIGAAGAGKLCAARTFEVVGTVRVYRVWNSAQAYTANGRWWALEAPHGTRDEYRAAYAVCPEWSALDRVTACDLRVGAHVALGPGQSVTCQGNVSYPVSSALQLYVPNDTRANPPQLFVENCTDGAPWP